MNVAVLVDEIDDRGGEDVVESVLGVSVGVAGVVAVGLELDPMVAGPSCRLESPTNRCIAS